MRLVLASVLAALGCNPLVELGDEYCFDESCQPAGASTSSGATSGTGGVGTTFRDVVLADGPLAYYRLDEPAMSTQVLSEVGGHAGITRFEVANDVTFAVEGALAGDPSPAIHLGGRGALTLDAPVDFASAAPHSIELFVRSAIASNEYLHPLMNINADVGWSLKIDSTSLSYIHHGGGGPDIRFAPFIPSDTWQHVVVAFDGSAVTFYLRGQPTGPAQSISLVLPAYQANLEVRQAAQPTPPDVPAAFDEIVFYDRALTWQEACNHYRCSRDRAACANPTNTCDGT